MSNATVFLETNPTSTGGKPSLTIWFWNGLNPHITGFGTYITTFGTGAGTAPSPGGYGTGQFN
ncbi:MAG: hypothetical protein JOZ16_16525 [Methylobacteriaceae bacterium]|nr:hypothetical protein [Methylobacteriaceae bacterium]